MRCFEKLKFQSAILVADCALSAIGLIAGIPIDRQFIVAGAVHLQLSKKIDLLATDYFLPLESANKDFSKSKSKAWKQQLKSQLSLPGLRVILRKCVKCAGLQKNIKKIQARGVLNTRQV